MIRNENVHKWKCSQGILSLKWKLELFSQSSYSWCTWVKFLTPNHSPGLQHMYVTFLYSMYWYVFVYYFFTGTDCKTERVGIRIHELTFKQLYTDQESADFKVLESSLLSAVSCFKHAINDCRDQIYMPWRFWRTH